MATSLGDTSSSRSTSGGSHLNAAPLPVEVAVALVVDAGATRNLEQRIGAHAGQGIIADDPPRFRAARCRAGGSKSNQRT
jgi:hypothetical protein